MKHAEERRYLGPQLAPVEVLKREDGKSVIAGYAAVYYTAGSVGTEYQLWDDAIERIRPGAFTRACSEKHDVRGLYNHDSNVLLGRSASGTCRYAEDMKGLRYEIDVDENDPDHQRVLAKIVRGDLTGSSFAFRATKVTWEDEVGKPSVRWIEDVNLFDVGPVTYPAYEGTTTGVRAEDGLSEVEAEYKAWQESRNHDATETEETMTETQDKTEETRDVDPIDMPPVEENGEIDGGLASKRYCTGIELYKRLLEANVLPGDEHCQRMTIHVDLDDVVRITREQTLSGAAAEAIVNELRGVQLPVEGSEGIIADVTHLGSEAREREWVRLVEATRSDVTEETTAEEQPSVETQNTPAETISARRRKLNHLALRMKVNDTRESVVSG